MGSSSFRIWARTGAELPCARYSSGRSVHRSSAAVDTEFEREDDRASIVAPAPPRDAAPASPRPEMRSLEGGGPEPPIVLLGCSDAGMSEQAGNPRDVGT